MAKSSLSLSQPLIAISALHTTRPHLPLEFPFMALSQITSACHASAPYLLVFYFSKIELS